MVWKWLWESSELKYYDSKLVALQMLGVYEARSNQMLAYHKMAKCDKKF